MHPALADNWGLSAASSMAVYTWCLGADECLCVKIVLHGMHVSVCVCVCARTRVHEKLCPHADRLAPPGCNQRQMWKQMITWMFDCLIMLYVCVCVRVGAQLSFD